MVVGIKWRMEMFNDAIGVYGRDVGVCFLNK